MIRIKPNSALMIKAALFLSEDDMEMAKVRAYVVYEYEPDKKLLTAHLVKEVEILLGPEAGEYEGQAMVARQKTSKDQAKRVENVEACQFLDMMGEYNKVGHLKAITIEGEEDNA
jgi:hypothetical protein